LDHALYPALHALYSPDEFARGCGLRAAPPDDLIVFHTVFGTSVPDIRLNAIADPGYAEACRLSPVWPGADPFAGTGREGQGPARGSAQSG
jgi:2-methylfumaryl-CoA hydratase